MYVDGRISDNNLLGDLDQNIINRMLDENLTIAQMIDNISRYKYFDNIYKTAIVKFIILYRPDKNYLIDCDDLGLL